MYIVSQSAMDDERIGKIVMAVRALYPDMCLTFLDTESAAMINYRGVKDISDHLDYSDTETVGKWNLLSQDQRIQVLTSLIDREVFDDFQGRLFEKMMDTAPERINKIYEEDGGTYIRTREEIAANLCRFFYDHDPYCYGDDLPLEDDGFEFVLDLISNIESAIVARDNVANVDENPDPALLDDLNRVVSDLEYSEPFQQHTKEEVAIHVDSFYCGRKNASPAIEWINDLITVTKARDDVQKAVDHANDIDGFHLVMYETLLVDLNQQIENITFWHYQ